MKTSKDAKGQVSKRNCIDLIFVECPDGYEVNSDKNECLDIDECKTTNCPYLSDCINTERSYRCQCKSGYEPKNGG